MTRITDLTGYVLRCGALTAPVTESPSTDLVEST